LKNRSRVHRKEKQTNPKEKKGERETNKEKAKNDEGRLSLINICF